MNMKLTAVLVLALLAVVAARIPRNDKERQQDEERLRRQQESGIHTYYLLIKAPEGAKNDKARSEALAADFHKRLGGDNHIHIVAASKVRAPALVRAAVLHAELACTLLRADYATFVSVDACVDVTLYMFLSRTSS